MATWCGRFWPRTMNRIIFAVILLLFVTHKTATSADDGRTAMEDHLDEITVLYDIEPGVFRKP